MESPVPGNRHAGFGRRSGETHRWQHRQGAPGRPHRAEGKKHNAALICPPPLRRPLRNARQPTALPDTGNLSGLTNTIDLRFR